MLRKSVGFIFVALVINSSFAVTIEHGLILDHQEWTSGHTPIQVKDLPHNTNKSTLKSIAKNINLANDHENPSEGVLLRSIVDLDMKGHVGTKTDMFGWIDSYIENNTSEVQTYTITSNFCILTLENYPCSKNVYKIQLDPQGYFSLELKKVFSYNFTEARPYMVLYSLMADNGKTNFATYDQKLVNITD